MRIVKYLLRTVIRDTARFISDAVYWEYAEQEEQAKEEDNELG